MASLYLQGRAHLSKRKTMDGEGAGDGHALAAAAHCARADEVELALGDLDDLGRVGIVCDSGDVRVAALHARNAAGARTPDFA